MALIKTYEEINEKIKKGKAVVVTAKKLLTSLKKKELRKPRKR